MEEIQIQCEEQQIVELTTHYKSLNVAISRIYYSLQAAQWSDKLVKFQNIKQRKKEQNNPPVPLLQVVMFFLSLN